MTLDRSTIIYDKGMRDEPLKDNAGKNLPVDIAVRTNSIHDTVSAAVRVGSPVIMIGARTSATNNFGIDYGRLDYRDSPSGVTGIQAATLAPDRDGNLAYSSTDYHDLNDRYRHANQIPVRSDEIRLNRHREGDDHHTITIGAGITFSQVNHVLHEAFADDAEYDYYVPIDLTTTDVAHAGAVYATGAQGPSRFRISDIARSITITDGEERKTLTNPDDIETHQGLWGMTGGVVDMELAVFRRPKHRFGFFVPLRSGNNGGWTEQAAAVLALLKEATALDLSDGHIRSDWKDGFIDGIEVFSRDSLTLVADTALPSGTSRGAAKRILSLMNSRERNGTVRSQSDFGVYITGNSSFKSVDEFLTHDDSPLAKLVTSAEGHEQLLYVDGMRGIVSNLHELEEMRLLRESFADIARQHAKQQEKGEAKPFSQSTDVNCFIDPEIAAHMGPDELRQAYRLILQPYFSYECRVRDLANVARSNGVTVTMSRYGHLHPRSLNPHTRVTIHAPEDSIHAQVYQQIILRAREHLVKILMDVSKIHPEIRVEGGEKGKMTTEAFEIMDEHRRMETAEVLAEANPLFQPHLKGPWADLVDQARLALSKRQTRRMDRVQMTAQHAA